MAHPVLLCAHRASQRAKQMTLPEGADLAPDCSGALSPPHPSAKTSVIEYIELTLFGCAVGTRSYALDCLSR